MSEFKNLIYHNPLSRPEEVAGFIMEGEALVTFPNGRMRIASALPPELEQDANYLYWCPERFDDEIMIEWDFYPLSDTGLCMFFFAAEGMDGRDLFDPGLAKRCGRYEQYHSGDINTLHLAYYRRRYPQERQFRVCNLRKSKGAKLVAQAGDPLPPLADSAPPYHMSVVKNGRDVSFAINGMQVLTFHDNDTQYLKGGRIGFRQMSPMTGEYADLKVYARV